MARGGDVHNPGVTTQNMSLLKHKTEFLYAKNGSYSAEYKCIIFAQEGEVKKEMWDNGQRV